MGININELRRKTLDNSGYSFSLALIDKIINNAAAKGLDKAIIEYSSIQDLKNFNKRLKICEYYRHIGLMPVEYEEHIEFIW